MVENVMHITSEYEERLRRCKYVPRLSFGRRMLTDDRAPNRFFLMHLFCNETMAIQYLKDIGLIILRLDLVLFFLITYHHSLLSIHSSCWFIPTILTILRLGLVLFFFLITYHQPLHSFDQNLQIQCSMSFAIRHFPYVTHTTLRYTSVADYYFARRHIAVTFLH